MVYAGAEVLPDGKVRLATGRYCEWKHKTVDLSEEVDTFEEYKATLRLQCDPGRPGTFYWTPDSNTPNEVYYQVGIIMSLCVIMTNDKGISSGELLKTSLLCSTFSASPIRIWVGKFEFSTKANPQPRRCPPEFRC